MSLFSIYFSPTGGTKKVMDVLAGGWGEHPDEIDLSDPVCDFTSLSFTKQDICLIGVPSFGGRVPETALSRLSSVKANGATAILVVTYGNRAYDDTFCELEDCVNACGFQTAAAVSAVTEHSIMRQFGTGRPDESDQARLHGFSLKLCSYLNSGKAGGELSLPGNRPFREYHGVPFKPKVGKDCTECGVCAKLCPVGAIPAEHPKQTDADLCISCMRCISVCPARARSLNKAALFAAGQSMKKAFDGRKPNELFLPL